MCNKKNLPSRITKAKAAIAFAKVTQCNKEGQIKSVVLPGSKGKRYQVIVRRDNKKLSTELLLLTGNCGYVKPQYSAQITYHQMAAIMMAASEAGYKIAWAANYQDAKRLERLGGKLFCLYNHDNPNNIMYGIMKKEN
ncbi:hypothetical protein GF373_17845 [bacterium]|nr:hypothetical protein [bacterium]